MLVMCEHIHDFYKEGCPMQSLNVQEMGIDVVASIVSLSDDWTSDLWYLHSFISGDGTQCLCSKKSKSKKCLLSFLAIVHMSCSCARTPKATTSWQ